MRNIIIVLPSLVEFELDRRHVSAEMILQVIQQTLEVLRENRKTQDLDEENVYIGNMFILDIAGDADLRGGLLTELDVDLDNIITAEDISYIMEECQLLEMGYLRN